MDWLAANFSEQQQAWGIAMFAITILMTDRSKMRTWLALFLAFLAAWAFPFEPIYILIDLVAAAVVIGKPRGWAQKEIVRLFMVMMCFEIGFVLSPQMNREVVAFVGQVLGWMQWLLLLGWGLYDRFGMADGDRWRAWPSLAHWRTD